MLRRNFLASAAALLTLPVAKLFGGERPRRDSAAKISSDRIEATYYTYTHGGKPGELVIHGWYMNDRGERVPFERVASFWTTP